MVAAVVAGNYEYEFVGSLWNRLIYGDGVTISIWSPYCATVTVRLFVGLDLTYSLCVPPDMPPLFIVNYFFEVLQPDHENAMQECQEYITKRALEK